MITFVCIFCMVVGALCAWLATPSIRRLWLDKRERWDAENKKLRKHLDSQECQERFTKRGYCKTGQTNYRCWVCEARRVMALPDYERRQFFRLKNEP